MIRKKILPVWAALTAICLLPACGGKQKEAAKEASAAEELPVVRTAAVEEREVPQLATFTATVEPEIINNISAAMANRIKEIYVDEGMQVSAGQKLVLLDDVNTTTYEAQVENARAALKLAETNHSRAVELLNIGGGTQQNVDQMETQLVNARNALSTAERTLRNARENTLLTSPISGVVTARNYDPGDMTGQLPILTVARVKPVKVVINVSESDFSKVRKGMPAQLTFQSYGDEEFTGHVSMIAPTVSADSRTFGVEIALPNSDGRVLPGMFGRATLDLGQSLRAVVPDKAVVKQQGSAQQYVYLYNPGDGTVRYTPVETGRRLGDSYELLTELPQGAEVVTTGQTRLIDGAKVKLQNAPR